MVHEFIDVQAVTPPATITTVLVGEQKLGRVEARYDGHRSILTELQVAEVPGTLQ